MTDLASSVVDADNQAAASAVDVDPAGDEYGGYQRKKLGLGFWLSAIWLGSLLIAIVFADLLPLDDPKATFRGLARKGPTADHWFGGDNIGHDVFSQTIYGARNSLIIAGIATVVGLTLGCLFGLLAGFYRGPIETAMMGSVDIVLAFPGLVLAIAIVTFLGDSTFWVTFTLAVLSIPTIARIVRAQVLVNAEREFVLASRTLGARNNRIMLREILPNVLPAMFSFALLGVAGLIVVQAALAVLGIGDPTQPSWGVSINNGRNVLDEAPHIALFPSLFMFLTILSLNLMGDKVRDVLDVREAAI